MKAVLCTAYGPPGVLKLADIDKPKPKPGQVLVRVHATTVSRADTEIRKFEFPGWIWLPLRLYFGVTKPRVNILGEEFAGVVEDLGDGTTAFRVGDRILGTTGIGLGAYAEYLCLGGPNETCALAKMPPGMSFTDAAAIPYGSLEALHFLRKGGIQRGQKVLVIGAGGSFGTYAVQLAKYYGAEVTAVDGAGKLEMLRAIGADQVVDYAKQDYTEGGEEFDLIFDVVCRMPLEKLLRRLKAGGACLLANPQTGQLLRGLRVNLKKQKRVIFGADGGGEEDLKFILELIESGKLRPVIDRCYPLERMVEAHQFAETEQKKGAIVVTVMEDERLERG